MSDDLANKLTQQQDDYIAEAACMEWVELVEALVYHNDNIEVLYEKTRDVINGNCSYDFRVVENELGKMSEHGIKRAIVEAEMIRRLENCDE